MRGLAVIVSGNDPARFRTALMLAAAHAALGAPTRMLIDQEAVRLVATAHPEALETCFDLGVVITLCQSGMAAAGLDASALDPRFAYGGMVGLLADLGEDRLVVA